MKKYLKLQIGSGNCDLPEKGISFDITKRINDGLTPAGGGLERAIPLPVTKNNQDIFSRWDYATENNALGVAFQNATLICNGIVLADGRAQQTAVQDKQFKVTLYDGNADWITRLSNLKLRDLDWSAERHDLTAGNILTGYNAAYGGVGWCYIIAKTKDSVTVPVGYGANTGLFAHNIYNSVPALFCRHIIDKIFTYLGLVYNSDFLETNLGSGLIMPFPLPDKYGSEFSDDYLTIRGVYSGAIAVDSAINLGLAGIELTSQTQTPPVGVNPLVLSALSYIPPLLSFQYTAKATGYYNVVALVTVDNITAPCTLSFVVAAASPASIASSSYTLTAANDGDTLTFNQVVYLVIGDVLEMFADITAAAALDITAVQLTITGEAEIMKDSPIDFKYFLSDWLCSDFLKGLGQMFNLQFETNVGGGAVTIEPLDDYLYTETDPDLTQINAGFLTGVNDWRYKEDLSRERGDSFNKIPNKTVFEYKEDGSDKTVEALNKDSDLSMLASQYTRPLTQFKDGVAKETNSFFAATISLFDAQIKATTSVKTPLIPLFWSENFAEQQTFATQITTYQPRILWFGGQRLGLDGYTRLVNELAFVEVQVPAAFMVNFNDTSGLDQCLAMGNQTINGIEIQGLTQRFYLKSLARTTRNRLRNAFFYLNDIDASMLSFRKRIFADGLWWILQEMRSYNPLNPDATQCELLLDVAENEDDIISITASVVPSQTGYLT